MAFTVTIDFDDGVGPRDVSNLVLQDSFIRRRTLWKSLAPQSNYLTFKMQRDSTIIALLLGSTTKEFFVVVTKDSGDYFSGLIRRNFKIVTTTLPQPVDIECVDYSAVWLRKRVDTTFLWAGYAVCDPSSTATSVVHQLLALAGYTAAEISISTTIADTIDYLAVAAGPDAPTYWDLLTKMLFEFGYVWTHDEAGRFTIYNFLPSSITEAGELDNDSMVGTLEVQRQDAEYEAATVTWYTHKTETSKIVFEETRGAANGLKCNVQILADAHYPPNADTAPGYAEYRFQDKEIVAVQNAVVDSSPFTGLVADTFTNLYRRALVDYHNTGAAGYLTRFDIIGDVTYRDQLTISKRMPTTTEKIYKVDALYLDNGTDADKLADGLYQYFIRSAMRYLCRSRTEYHPGDIVGISETNLGIDATGVVVEIADDGVGGEYAYVVEGIAAYVAAAVTRQQIMEPPSTPQIPAGALTVAASTYSGYYDYHCDAVEDGETITDALTEMQGRGGGVVHLTAGNFKLQTASGHISLMVGCVLEGEGEGTVLEIDYDGAMYGVVMGSGTELRNLKIIDNYGHSTGVFINGGDGNRVKNVICDGVQYALWFTYATNLHVEGCSVIDAYYGLMLGDCNGFRIIGNYFEHIGRYAITTITAGSASKTAGNITKNTIKGGGTVPLDVGHGMYIDDALGTLIEGNVIEDLGYGGINVTSSCIHVIVKGNFITGDGCEYGIDAAAIMDGGTGTVIEGNTIEEDEHEHGAIYVWAEAEDAMVTGNSCRNNRNIVHNSFCYGTLLPGLISEHGVATNATVTADTVVFYDSDSSQKATKSVAAGTAAKIIFTDNENTDDLHGVIAGQTYSVKIMVKIPATGGPAPAEVTFVSSQYYSGSWHETELDVMATTDAWEELSGTIAINSAATGFFFGIRIASTAEVDEYLNYDHVMFRLQGWRNYHESQLEDDGTNTRVG